MKRRAGACVGGGWCGSSGLARADCSSVAVVCVVCTVCTVPPTGERQQPIAGQEPQQRNDDRPAHCLQHSVLLLLLSPFSYIDTVLQ